MFEQQRELEITRHGTQAMRYRMEIGGGPIFNFDPDFLPQIKRTNPLSQKHEVDALDCRGAALIIKLIDTYFDN